MSFSGKTAEATLRTSSPEFAEAAPLSPESGFPAAMPAAALEPGPAHAGSDLALMIELMETAAARWMRPYLRAGESSIALEFNMANAAHMEAAVAGRVAMRAVAIHRGAMGRLHRFTLHAFDEAGLIGSAEHVRAVVDEKRFMALARKRAGRASMLLRA